MVRMNQVDCDTTDDSSASTPVSKVSSRVQKSSQAGSRMTTLASLMGGARRRLSMGRQTETFAALERPESVPKTKRKEKTSKTVTFDPMTTVYNYSGQDIDPDELWWTTKDYAKRRAEDKKLACDNNEVKQHLQLLLDIFQKFQCSEFHPDESFQSYLRPARKGFRAGFRGLEHWQIRPATQRRTKIEAVLSISHCYSATQLAVFAAENSTEARQWARALGQADEEAARKNK